MTKGFDFKWDKIPTEVKQDMHLHALSKYQKLTERQNKLLDVKAQVETELEELGQQIRGYEAIMAYTDQGVNNLDIEGAGKDVCEITDSSKRGNEASTMSYDEVVQRTNPDLPHDDSAKVYPQEGGWNDKIMFIMYTEYQHRGLPLKTPDIINRLRKIDTTLVNDYEAIRGRVSPFLSGLVKSGDVKKLKKRGMPGNQYFYVSKDWFENGLLTHEETLKDFEFDEAK